MTRLLPLPLEEVVRPAGFTQSGCDPSQKETSVFYESSYFMTFLVSLGSQSGVGNVKLDKMG